MTAGRSPFDDVDPRRKVTTAFETWPSARARCELGNDFLGFASALGKLPGYRSLVWLLAACSAGLNFPPIVVWFSAQ